MNCGGYIRPPLVWDKTAAFLCQAVLTSKDRLRCRRSETNDNRWPDQRHLRFQPRPAGPDFKTAGFLVYPPFPALLEFEMFNCVRDVSVCTVNTGFLEPTVQ